MEAEAAGAHNLDATDADIQSNKVFIAVPVEPNGSPRKSQPRKKPEPTKTVMSKPIQHKPADYDKVLSGVVELFVRIPSCVSASSQLTDDGNVLGDWSADRSS